MYKDIISYELAEHISEQNLLSIAQQIIESWMKHQTGFLKWEIHKNSDNSYTDVVYWNSEADAKQAEKKMGDIPNANEWYSCYKEGTISSKNLTQIASF